MIKQGDVLLFDEITSHKGKAIANPGEILVGVFLGSAARDNENIQIVPTMNALGWFQTSFWEVETETVAEGEIRIQRTIFSCEGKHKAAEAGVRFARRAAMDLSGRVRSLAIRVVRIGQIAVDGAPLHEHTGLLLTWDENRRETLDSMVEGLKL